MIQPIFYIVRHGATNGNTKQTYRAWSNAPDAQLNAQGRDDVREAGIFLKSLGLNFPLIISDDLDRTVESREILADILGIKHQETDKRLRPLNVGDFTGKSKIDHPLEPYLNDPSKVIPGGESVQHFDARQTKFFHDISLLVEKIKSPVLLVGHGSTVSFLHNHTGPPKEKIGYEGLMNPGGVAVFVKDGIIPLTKKREGGGTVPLKDGTAVSGYVDAKENKPPRECWNCRWAGRDINDLLGCRHRVVRLDPKLQDRKQSDGTIAVGDRDCCDMFANKIAT